MLAEIRRQLQPGDAIILLLAVALVGLAWGSLAASERAWTVQVQAAGVQHEYPAWTRQDITVSGPLGETHIEIRNGRARVTASPCSRKICILAGWLEHGGETAACIPNEVAISMLARDPRFDAVNF